MTSINGEAPFLDMSAETGPANNHGQRSMEHRSLYDPVEAAQDSRAVNRFSKFMLAKMAQAGAGGRSGWYDKERCTREYLSDMLRRAVAKGDPVDIANFAMMLHDRGETVAPICGEFDPDFLDPADQIEIIYTNYKGETAKRTITPLNLWRGATEWHPEPQWLVTAYDHDKKALRDFALKDFGYQAGKFHHFYKKPTVPEAAKSSNAVVVVNEAGVDYLVIGEEAYSISFIKNLLEKEEQRRDARITAGASVPTSAFPNGLEVITYPVASFLHEPGKLDAPVAALSGRLHRSHAKAIAAAITGTAPKITIEGE
ncbi:hypothetical protein [Brucella intermedia]|uniref:hypothetical protein n=1 Tax=Brucella intermedia TaxID=94625 RepID=UPI00235EE791|nr:hypothetical protein [Brucella intermedia]